MFEIEIITVTKLGVMSRYRNDILESNVVSTHEKIVFDIKQ